jgi:chromosome segregation ATPase
MSRLQHHFKDLTTGTLTGTGLFDELMRTVKEHLNEEFNSQRVRGTDYSKVYLGSMEATLSNAVQYLIGIGLIDAELEKVHAETQLVLAQTQRERELLPLQKLQIQAEIDRTKAQTAQIQEEVKLIPLQLEKLREEIKLTQAQLTELQYRVQNLLPLEKEVLTAQRDKTRAEVALVNAKTSDTLNNANMTAAQIALLHKQAAAFDTEMRIKKQKIVADAWSAMVVADPAWGGGPRHYNEAGL